MSRISHTFEALRRRGRKALIPFFTAGDPEPALTVPLMHALVDSGVDIIELGVPFSDPMADGPTIQRSSERALKHRVGLKDVLAMVAEFRTRNDATPVVLMGYANPVEAMGYEAFVKRAVECGVDGVLIVDYPPQEAGDLVPLLAAAGIDPIFLLSPTTPAARVEQVGRLARGYVYYVSLKGVTGAAHLDLSDVTAKLPQLRSHIRIPIGVGFGIRDGETARAVAGIADAVVVGSRIVQEMERSAPGELLGNVSRLVSGLRRAMDS